MVFEQKWVEKFFADPVLGITTIFGARLDDFQRVRIRYCWFTAFVVDSSGWSSGKTICEWFTTNLRCILIPNHLCGVYYPNWSLGQTEFWDRYFTMFQDRDLLKVQFREGKNEWKAPGCWRKEYRNGSLMQLPAPGFSNDADNQVSRRFNTLCVGEYTKAAVKGEGIDELLGRVTAPSFNKNHPVWGNHVLLSAHAEAPSHPSYKYIRGVKRSIAGKNTAAEQHSNAVISFCFLDWSKKPIDPANPHGDTFQKFREDAAINRSRRTLSRDEFRRRALGILTPDGKGWYNDFVLERCLQSGLRPELRRVPAPVGAEIFYTLGADFAPGQSGKADECSFVVWKAQQILDMRLIDEGLIPTLEFSGQYYFQCPVYAHSFKNVDAGQISGYIHFLHLCFGFSLISMDKGGGGAWVYKELVKPVQLIRNQMQTVVPLCTRDEVNQLDKQPIVVFFKRGGEMNSLWQSSYLESDEGVIEAAHRRYLESWQGREHRWPQPPELWPRSELAKLSPEEIHALKELAKAYKQHVNVRVKLDSAGNPLHTKRAFLMFEAKGATKKDAAYASLYGKMGMDLVLSRGESGEDEEDALG